MANKLLLSEITHASSKQQEVDALNQLCGLVAETQTYLESLLNPKMLDWFANKVHNDADCNLLYYYEYQCDLVQQGLAELDKARREQSEMAANSQAWVETKERENQTLRDELIVYKRELEQTRNDLFAEGRQHRDDVERLSKSEDRIRLQLESAEDRVAHLKSKLYDLMTERLEAGGE